MFISTAKTLMLAVLCMGTATTPLFGQTPQASQTPRTPAGVPPCVNPLPLPPIAKLPLEESLRYQISVNGIGVGHIDFKIAAQSVHRGRTVYDYRTTFALDSLVATFLSAKGRAATLIPLGGITPLLAMNDYTAKSKHYKEQIVFDNNGRGLKSTRHKDTKVKQSIRRFKGDITDIVGGFYSLRNFPVDVRGCYLLYSNQRAYTLWIKPHGVERIKTPVGYKNADRYDLIYGHERSKHASHGSVWLAKNKARFPYAAQLNGMASVRAEIAIYKPGKYPKIATEQK